MQADHDIILSMDANETYEPECTGSFCPLQYNPGKPTICKTHHGNFLHL
jgi:hypothetical protein